MAESNGKLISELKVHELRSELINRGLDGNGVKAALVGRLEKILSEQGVDINSYLFTTSSDTAPASTNMEAENNDAAVADVFASKDETGKNKEEQKEAVLENVKPIEPQVKAKKENDINSSSLTADDLVEKVEDEIDEAELHGETDDATLKKEVNTNQLSPDIPIGDLEEREESEGDDTKNQNVPIKTESENKEEQQQQQTTAIHEISDEEDLDEDMLDDDNADSKTGIKEEQNPTADIKPEPVTEAKAKEADEKSNKDTPQKPAKSKIPAGLNFPSDDPHGLRCIWIRSIPSETRLAELKLAFIDAGFTVETAKIFTTKQSSRPSAFGFMTLSSQEEAKTAVEKMNNSIFKGKTISVERACDSSMLQSDLLPTERPKVSHPPIKPPEDNKPASDSSRSRIITTNKSSRSRDISHPRSERRHSRSERSPYMNTVNRARIVRTDPQRVVETSGRTIRVVATRDAGSSSRPSRSSRRSPIRPPRERTPPRRERTPPRRHRSPDRERIAEHERRKYEEMMRKKEEEFKRKEEALRMEAERNRIKLEKERLEKENLELKLRLQKEQLRAAATSSSSRRQSPPHARTSSRHREPTPPRRSSPPRSSRHASPPRHHPPSRRTPTERHDPRHPSLPSYRQEEPPKEVYPTRRRSRSRSPVRGYPVGSRDRPDEFSRGRGHEHGSSSRHTRPESPIRNAPPAKSYERHSPRRNYETSRNDRSRRNDKVDVTYPPPPEEASSRSSRSNRNGNGNGRDFPVSNSFDRPSGGNDSYGTTRRDPGNQYSVTASSNPATYNFTGGSTTDYRTSVNPSYSAAPSNGRNQLPVTSTWPQQTYATTNQAPAWAHQPQSIASIPQWNPQSNFTNMRNNNSNQRYGGF